MTADACWFSELDVAEHLDLPAAIAAIRESLTAEAMGDAATMAKAQITWGGEHTLHAIGGVTADAELVGTKTWAHTGGGATPLLILWNSRTGVLRAVIEAFALGQLRTAAMSGLATSLLAPVDASVGAVVGTGKQALPQLAAILAVRDVRSIRIFSPNPDHRDAFVAMAADASGVECTACSDVASAVRDATIITTVTRATTPFLESDVLPSDVHINAVGAISPDRAELTGDVYEQSALVVADAVEAARRLAVEVPETVPITPLSDLTVDGPLERPSGITIFKAMGIGLADVALGGLLLKRVPDSVGRSIPAPSRVAPRLFGGDR